MSIGDFFKGIAGPVAGGLTSLIPGVGPVLAPLAGGAVNSLVNGGSSGGGGGSTRQQEALLAEMFGFENGVTNFLDSPEYLYFDAEDDYNDSLRSRNYFDNVFDAVQDNNLDYFQASQMLQSAFRPNSEFYAGQDFEDFLNARVGKETTRNIIDNAFRTNFMRDGSDEEIAQLTGWLDATGQNKSPLQISSAVNRNLMGSLEGERKSPYTAYEVARAAPYGGYARTAKGDKTYLVNPYRRGGSASPTMGYDEQYGVA